MDEGFKQLRRPPAIPNSSVAKAALLYVVFGDLMEDQTFILKTADHVFYRQRVKSAIKTASNVLDEQLKDYLAWQNAEDKEPEQGYIAVRRMVERFGKILLTTPGEEFEQLDAILEAFEKKKFMFTDKVLFNKVSNESNNN